MDMRDVDPEVTVLGILVFILAVASLSIGLLPQFPLPLKHLPLILGLLLGFVGGCALYADPYLESRWALWIVLAKDMAIGTAFLILGLVLGSG